MPLQYQATVSPALAAADELQQLLYERQQQRIAAEALAYKRQQDAEQAALDARKVAVSEGTLDLARHPAPKPHSYTTIKGLRAGTGPGAETGIFDTTTGEVTARLPEAATVPTGMGSDYAQFLKRYAASLGKTVESLTADEELAGRKRFGQADDAAQHTPVPIVVTGPQGPIVVDRGKKTATAVTMDDTGAPVGRPVPSGMAAQVASIEQSLDALQDLKGLKQDDWLGPVQGRLSEASVSVPGVQVPPDLAKFVAQTATLTNATIKAITGAQMSEVEAKRIKQQIPLLTDKPQLWEAKAAATEQNLTFLYQRMLQIAGATPGAGATPAGRPAAPNTPRTAGAAGTVRMRAPNGQTRDVPAAEVDHYRALGAVVVVP